MTAGRILAIVVIGTVVVFLAMTAYNTVKTAAAGSDGTNALQAQRRGEWNPAVETSSGAKALQEQRRGEWMAKQDMSALDGKLDSRDRIVLPTKTPAFQRGEWMIRR